MIDKALLTGAFEKMGPERVERMLLAFGPLGDQTSYCRCALGFAGGFEEHTTRALGDEMRRTLPADMLGVGDTILWWFAQRLDITIEEAEALEDCHCFSANRREFLPLANEWLENRPASLRATSRETADVDTQTVGACRFGRGE